MCKNRCAVVGIGARSSLWLIKDLLQRKDVEIVALCDVMPQKAEWAKEEYSIADAKIFSDATDMLKKTECDSVMVMTSDSNHAEVVVPCLQSGKTVFCEKPLEVTLGKCKEIIDADGAVGGKTFVGFNLRYSPVYVMVKKMIDAGEVGDILTIQADEFYNGGRSYFRRWNRFREKSGGLWVTKASHDFDILQWLAGVSPLEVYATTSKSYYAKKEAAMQCRDCALSSSCPDRASDEPPMYVKIREECGGEPYDLCLYNSQSDTFDHGIATVLFENNVMATYTCNVVSGFTDRRIRVSGTKGTIDGSLCNNSVTLMRRDPNKREEIPVNSNVSGGHGGADEHVMKSFFDFANNRCEPKCRPKDAVVAVAMGLAATKASDEHRVVKMNELLPLF